MGPDAVHTSFIRPVSRLAFWLHSCHVRPGEKRKYNFSSYLRAITHVRTFRLRFICTRSYETFDIPRGCETMIKPQTAMVNRVWRLRVPRHYCCLFLVFSR